MIATTRWLATAAAGVAALAALAGCGAGTDDSGGESAGAGQVAEREGGDGAVADPEAAAEAAAGDEDSAGGQDTGGMAGGAVVDTRSVIYSGHITVRVADVDEAADAAESLADRHGGFVGGDRRSADEDGARATMVLRIPSEDFSRAVNGLGELGEEESREIETEDVTEEVVDLETRIATAEASVERTRALLVQAESISDIVKVEQELSQREAALGSLQARQRELADLTALSTITVTLLGPETEPAADDDDTGFLAGLATGWRGFTTSMTVLVTGLGVLLPWLVVIGVPATAVWWARRRRAVRPIPAMPPPADRPPASSPGA